MPFKHWPTKRFAEPVFSFLLLSLLIACRQEPRPVLVRRAGVTSPAQKTEIVIAAVGDVMMPASVQAAAVKSAQGYGLLFEKVAQDLRAADITFANLETPVDQTAPATGYPAFNARPELPGALKRAGFSVVSLANNHAMDAGTTGLRNTIDNVDAAGLVFTGAGRTKAEASQIKYINARGVKVAFLSYTYGVNRRLPGRSPRAPGVNILGNRSEADLARAASAVRQARTAADLVVVSLHWGDEYAGEPAPWQRQVVRVLINAGADIILGHHPHVLQPIESFEASDGRVGLIAFSLGNFISSQNGRTTYANKTQVRALRGDGIILYIFAAKENGKTQVVRAEFLPVWALQENAEKVPVRRPVILAREISRLEILPKRTPARDDLLKLLKYRLEVITDKLMSGRP